MITNCADNTLGSSLTIFDKLPEIATTKCGFNYFPRSNVWIIKDNGDKYIFDFDEFYFVAESFIVSFKLYLIHILKTHCPVKAKKAFRSIYFITKYIHEINSKPVDTISADNVLAYASLSKHKIDSNLLELRSILREWFDLGYSNIDSETSSILNKVKLKYYKSGSIVRMHHPTQGPFDEYEYRAITDYLLNNYASGIIDLSDLTLGFLCMVFGARPISFAMLRIRDFIERKDHHGITNYAIKIPAAKRKKSEKRTRFNTRKLTPVCEASEQLCDNAYLVAPSGCAARRISEATGRDAMTIASFMCHIDQQKINLDTEPIIAIDEASMLDLPLMYRLLRRLEPGCRLLLLGDPGQLPPISFGVTLHVLVEMQSLPITELREIHQQAAITGIPQFSSAIRSGTVPDIDSFTGQTIGIQFIDCKLELIPDQIINMMVDLGGPDAVRILTPLINGQCGTREINRLLHYKIGCLEQSSDEGFAIGEPVIWKENNYDMGLMNGSLGKIINADRKLIVDWDGEEKLIENPNDMEHAYGIKINKSQGSQFNRVIVPVFESKKLDRTTLYTAITRAKEQVVFIGNRTAFELAIIAPPSTSTRKTGFKFALDEALHMSQIFETKSTVSRHDQQQ